MPKSNNNRVAISAGIVDTAPKITAISDLSYFKIIPPIEVQNQAIMT
jgi:hypothetical protein